VLPGIVIAFLLSGTRQTLPMFLGALAAGVVATGLIEVIHRRSRVKVDAALGIVFTTLFAVGVILIALFADHVDLDSDCVLYGEIAFLPLHEKVRLLGVTLGPPELVRMGTVALAIGVLVTMFFKEMQVTSFDPGLAQSLGISPTVAHYALMTGVSLTVVSAFESVGSILVIAMLILPGVTASLLADRLRTILLLVVPQAVISSMVGLHLGLWLNASIAACMVVAASGLFVLAWIASPTRGLFVQWHRRRTQRAERLRDAASRAPA
jgi:manganese/zinc/iron transport system permease protein